MSCWYQANIKGQMLELQITEKTCENNEKCDEYVTKVHNDPMQYGFIFGLTSAIICLIMSIYLAIPTKFTDCFSLVCAFSSIAFIVLTSAKLFFRISSEQVLLVPSVGIQHTKQYKCGIKSHIFIPAGEFSDVLINEDIGWDHAFYLAVVMKDQEDKQKLLPLFKTTTPRLAFLQQVHNRIRDLLKKQK